MCQNVSLFLTEKKDFRLGSGSYDMGAHDFNAQGNEARNIHVHDFGDTILAFDSAYLLCRPRHTEQLRRNAMDLIVSTNTMILK